MEASLWRDLLPPLPWRDQSPPPGPLVAPPAERRRPTGATPRNMIAASLADSWCVLGVTGCGKTRFAKRLLRELWMLYPAANVYVLDSKGERDFTGWPGMIWDEEVPAPLPPARKGRGFLQVWQPPSDEWAAYSEWLEGILKARHPAIVLVDELSSLAKNQQGTSYPNSLAKLLKQGRSLQICPVICSQEATGIPRQVTSQAAHFVYFRLGRSDEFGIRRAMRLLDRAPTSGAPVCEPPTAYGFWHRVLRPAPSTAELYRDLQEFFG